jgi:hypothetical protein
MQALQWSEATDGLCQGRPAFCRALIEILEKEFLRQGRLVAATLCSCQPPHLRIGRRLMNTLMRNCTNSGIL